MNIDIITVEIGSTITKINAFDKIMSNSPIHIGQSISLTTVDQGDVNIGAQQGIDNLSKKLGEKINAEKILVNSSAAGGLKMAVFGLTYDMTARAAREASLGAGAIIKYIGSGKIQDYQIDELEDLNPNIILFAGGLDYGDTEITYHNAKILSSLPHNVPYIYCGNKQLQNPIEKLFKNKNKDIRITRNVYPDVDDLDTEPAREIIQHTFSEHIIHASGMEKLSELTDHEIIPTPFAVLKTAEIIYERMGDVVIVDVGGATTDIHSVCNDSPENASKRIEAVPLVKRTVEGDLGVYVNADNLNSTQEEKELFKGDLKDLKAIPDSMDSQILSSNLTQKAVNIALKRHCGRIKSVFTPSGKKKYVTGKDLTNAKYIIGTGGALTRLQGAKDFFNNIKNNKNKEMLLPREDCISSIDSKYIFSSLGTIAFNYPHVKIEKLVEYSMKNL